MPSVVHSPSFADGPLVTLDWPNARIEFRVRRSRFVAHTATCMVAAGVGKPLGHAASRTTEVYGRGNLELAREYVNRLPDFRAVTSD